MGKSISRFQRVPYSVTSFFEDPMSFSCDNLFILEQSFYESQMIEVKSISDSLIFSISVLIYLICVSCQDGQNSSHEISIDQPNIIIIYADDLGYGDVSAYGHGTLNTPNFDRIAKEGILFKRGYASSATCTPSRYALLTGQYPWKNKRARILPGNAPLIIDTTMQTLPKIMQSVGYKTAVIGKWHLGLGHRELDWNGKIAPGPNQVGFDYSYILASTNDRAPTVYVENDRVVGLESGDLLEVNYKKNFSGEPTGKENPEKLKVFPSHGHDMSIHNGISRIGFQRGGVTARYIDEDMSDTILSRSLKFIEKHQQVPFFLFYSLHQPHVPRVPHPRFIGQSGMGPRGDVILEADWAVGQVLDKIDQLGLAENTLILFSSDNGPVLNDGYQDQAVEKIGNHTPSGGLRGGKYSLYEAGTRVPLMIQWKGTIKPMVSKALVSQIDFSASFAKLLKVPVNQMDSQDLLDAFMGKTEKGRDSIVLEAIGRKSYLKRDWILIPPHSGSPLIATVNIETGASDNYQLYRLSDDRAQENNLAEKFPQRVLQMENELNNLLKN